MIYSRNLWFNPAYLLHCGFVAESAGVRSAILKAINETRATCIWALAANKLMGVQHLINIVDPKEQTPDTRVMLEAPPRGKTKQRWGQYLDIEVVTYGERETESIDHFLVKKKLSPDRAYQEGTIILCWVNKNITNGKLWKDISKDLTTAGVPKLDTFLLGKTHPIEPLYCIGRVSPEFDSIIQIDAMNEAKKKYAEPGGTRIIEFHSDDLKKLAALKSLIPPKGYNPFL
jgi:hypothetical protein